MECITVEWHGTFRLDRVDLYNVAYENGVYAIYVGRAGRENLLYIGKTKGEFITRINEHLRWISEIRGLVKIRFGILSFEAGKKYSKDKLSDVEALLITHHAPPHNQRNSRRYNGRRQLTVINRGRRGSIFHIISSEELDWS